MEIIPHKNSGFEILTKMTQLTKMLSAWFDLLHEILQFFSYILRYNLDFQGNPGNFPECAKISENDAKKQNVDQNAPTGLKDLVIGMRTNNSTVCAFWTKCVKELRQKIDLKLSIYNKINL